MSTKGKYILGVVDGLMCDEYREKVFTDVGNPRLQERCLEVIKTLKLDADQLAPGKKDMIKSAIQNYEKWHKEQQEEATKVMPDRLV